MSVCYLNGRYLPLAQATVSVMDRGFLFGDGVYEVVAVYQRRLFLWVWHKERLHRSLCRIHLNFDLDCLDAIIERIIAEDDNDNQKIYIQITRGVVEKRQHCPPCKATPTVFVMSEVLPKVDPQKIEDGINCITLEDFRWKCADIKATSLLPAVLLAADSAESHADEVVLLREGKVSEGFSSNYILVCNQKLFSPIADENVLDGVTCRSVLAVAHQIGYTVCRRDISDHELQLADELWLTSTTREMLPITRLDDKDVGNGRPGSVYRQVYNVWRQYKRRPKELLALAHVD